MKVVMLDGNSIINRTFYGIRMLNAPDGTPTNAVYGFLAVLMKLVEDESPDGICVTFDLPAPTFRHEAYDGYKARRRAMPEELAVQMPLLKEVLDAMGIRRYELEGYEADDIIGTLSRLCELDGCECLIVTGDKDSFQLISETTSVRHVKSRAGQTETILYDKAKFVDEYGFEPDKMIDLKALMGDASDNIPGVAGVGEKTAMALLHQFGSLDAVYAGLESVKPAVRRKLEADEDNARLSYQLAKIDTDAPLQFMPADCRFSMDFDAGLFQLFNRLGFRRYIEKWRLTGSETGAASSVVELLPEIVISDGNTETFLRRFRNADYVAAACGEGLETLEICDGKAVYRVDAAVGDTFYSAFFADDIKKVSHQVKDLLLILHRRGIEADGFVFDTALAAYLIAPTDSNYDIVRLSQKYLDRTIDENTAEALFALKEALESELEKHGLTDLFRNIELPLCYALADMERRGFMVDREALVDFGRSLEFGIDILRAEIYEYAGEDFNINSPKQLGTILFDKLALPHGKKTKTGWSTSADVLDRLAGKHPIIEGILQYRQLTKLKSTYADGLLKVIEDDGRIRSSFKMTVTATGRLSSTEPNLQNIPIRTELGGELRKMFVAPEGRLLVDADYSQIELRILAHISGDETMIAAFHAGEDIHAVTASQVFGVPIAEVTALQRSRAKAVNFGIVYGISDFSLAQDIGTTRSEAKEYIENYLSKYSGVRNYMTRVVEDARRDGFVSTIYGRKRPMPELNASDHNTRAFGERVALNMPIQGSAADIIKLAMVNVYRRLELEGLESRLILQIHDELIAECPEAEVERVIALLVEEMEGVARLSVPLIAEAHCGRSWYETK